MENKESKLPADWFQIAEKDLKRSEIMLKAKDYAAAGIFLQQSIEKYLIKYKAGSLKQEKFNEVIDKICSFLKN